MHAGALKGMRMGSQSTYTKRNRKMLNPWEY